MAQRYASLVAFDRMYALLCPECGSPPEAHTNDPRFWMPRNCDLTQVGVQDRIDQYLADIRDN